MNTLMRISRKLQQYKLIRQICAHDWLILCALFLFSLLFRGFRADFPKVASTYPDELYYLKYARDLWHGEALTVWGTHSSFLKILYPLFLAPAYAIQDGALRVSIISWINTALVSSALFPAYLLAKKVIRDKAWRWIFLFLFQTWVELAFSFSFMAENLFLPLSVWAVYLCFLSLVQNKPSSYHFFSGIFCFLCFLCKETALSYIAAYILGKLWTLRKQESRKHCLLSLLSFILGFGLSYGIARLLIPQEGSYYYDTHLRYVSFTDAEHILFFLRATLYYILYWLISIGFFPAILPLLVWKKLSREARDLYLFTLFIALFTLGGTVYSISMVENFGQSQLRIHLRYMIPAWVPTMVCFVQTGTHLHDLDRSVKTHLTVLILIFLMLCWLLLSMPFLGSPVDSLSLEYTRQLPLSLTSYKAILSVILLCICIIAWATKKRRLFWASFLLIAVLGLAGQRMSALMFKRTYASDGLLSAEETQHVEEALNSLGDWAEESLVVYSGNPVSPSERAFDTFVNEDPYTTNIVLFHRAMQETENCTLPPNFYTENNLRMWNIIQSKSKDYQNFIFFGHHADEVGLMQQDLEEVPLDNISDIHVYRRGLQPLRILKHGEYTLGSTLYFTNSSNFSSRYGAEGFSSAEDMFCWSEGNQASLSFHVLWDQPSDLQLDLQLYMILGDVQHLRVYCNNTLLLENDITNEDCTAGPLSLQISMELIPDGFLNLRFEIPDASVPGNGDDRLLGIAFRSLKLSPVTERNP